MLFRLALIVVGILVALVGWQELRLLQKSAAEPRFIELAELEAGRPLPNLHLRIGHHWKLWDELIYSYRAREGEDGDSPRTRIDYAFYPIISEGHPHRVAIDRLNERYDSLEQVPDDAWPTLQDFAVVIRTERFERVADLPESGVWTRADGLEGLVVNDIRRFDRDERNLLSTSYPALRLERVLIVEEGRRPESMAYCAGMIATGSGLTLLGLVLIVRATTGRKEGVGELPPLIKREQLAP